MYKVNNVEEFYDTLDEGHRIYLGEKVGHCVVPKIIGYAERHDICGIVIEGLSGQKLKDHPYYFYYLGDNMAEDDNGEIVKVSLFAPGMSNITIFNKMMFDSECFVKTAADGTIFFIPEYIEDSRYDTILRRDW